MDLFLFSFLCENSTIINYKALFFGGVGVVSLPSMYIYRFLIFLSEHKAIWYDNLKIIIIWFWLLLLFFFHWLNKIIYTVKNKICFEIMLFKRHCLLTWFPWHWGRRLILLARVPVQFSYKIECKYQLRIIRTSCPEVVSQTIPWNGETTRG